MKRIIFLLVGIALTVLIQAQTRIAVIADPHVLATSLFDDGSAFKSMIKGNPRVPEYSQHLFDSAVAIIADQQPDLVFLVGDMTNDGEKASHEYIVAKLQELKTLGVQPIVIPGNNDIANRNAYSYSGDTKTPTASITEAEFASMYSEFGYSQAVSREQDSLSYMVYPNDKLAVICLNSAHKNTPVTQYNLGGIYESTIQWAEQAAAQAKMDGRMILVLMHHQVTDHFNMEQVLTPNYIANTTDGYPTLETLQTRLLAAGVQVVFTGHYHMTSIKHTLNEGTQLYDVGTGSLSSYPSPFRWLTLNDNGKLDITTQTIDTYEALESERNTNTAKGIISRAASMAYPKIDSVRNTSAYKTLIKMFGADAIKLPTSRAKMEADMSACMLEPMTMMVNELSRGDENTRTPEQHVEECMHGFDTYLLDTVCVICSQNEEMKEYATMMVLLAVDDYRKLLIDMFKSVFYNYVGEDENLVVPDNTNTLQIAPAVISGISNQGSQSINQKVFRDGAVYIQRGGHIYDIVGKQID